MASEFDPKKSADNLPQPGRADLPFEAADRFDFETAVVRQDTRNHPKTGKPYAEPRFQAIGRIGAKVVFLVYTPKPAPVGFRTISLRKASKKERELWSNAQPKKPTKKPRS